MFKRSMGVATLFIAGLAGAACTTRSGLNFGGSGGALGTGGSAGSSSGAGGTQVGMGGESGGIGGAVGCFTTLCALPAQCPYGYQKSASLCGCWECAPPPATGGTGGTSSCPTIMCAVPPCVGGEFRPNPSDPCCPVICVPNTPDAGAAKDGGNQDAKGNPRDAISVADSGIAKRTPLQHRATAATCPTRRGPSSTSCVGSGCTSFGGCTQDSDCTAGINGRCLDLTPVPMLSCSYDQCFSDADCPGNAPCDCRNSAASVSANSCLTGSGCRLDSDCGPGNFCSPSPVSWNSTAYYCHTANDTCVDDSDCGQFQDCAFSAQNGYWTCTPITPAPP
jgi:hypothetical protein